MTHVAATRHLHQTMHIRLAPGYWTLVPSFRILRFFRLLGYRIELILYLLATSGANESTNSWKRGSFWSGSNIGSSGSSTGVSGTPTAVGLHTVSTNSLVNSRAASLETARAFHDRKADCVKRRAALAARREGRFCYWPVPLLAASACSIFFAISAFTASRLKLAPLCIGG